LTLEGGLTACPGASDRNYHSTLRKIPEDRRTQYTHTLLKFVIMCCKSLHWETEIFKNNDVYFIFNVLKFNKTLKGKKNNLI
jgi:hypothetical protein